MVVRCRALARLPLALLIAQATQAVDLSTAQVHGHHDRRHRHLSVLHHRHRHHLRPGGHDHDGGGGVGFTRRSIVKQRTSLAQRKAKAAHDVKDFSNDMDDDEANAEMLREAKAQAASSDDATDKEWDGGADSTGQATEAKAARVGQGGDQALDRKEKPLPPKNQSSSDQVILPGEQVTESQSDRGFFKQLDEDPDKDPYELEAEREGISVTEAPIIATDPAEQEAPDDSQSADNESEAEREAAAVGASLSESENNEAAQAQTQLPEAAEYSAEPSIHSTDPDDDSGPEAEQSTDGDASPSRPSAAQLQFAAGDAQYEDPYHRNREFQDESGESDPDAEDAHAAMRGSSKASYGSMSKEGIQTMETMTQEMGVI